ncbi:MAG: relaxase/mobilization nuclease domain-containing protein [Chitinophagaceae bacterium]|nr:relaxase/mobilization nuclease domain-containing protein [Chitinophagaceae bacterium]
MVARITTPKSLHKALNYNEQKVQHGTALCIGENGFLLSVNQMNFYDKKQLFENRNNLNERATTKTIHVSLNFSNSEDYNANFLMQIAEDYMSRIGFGQQPYLVYHHFDAGHPHIHILSTTIRSDGTRINTHNIGRNQSEIARKVIEEKYGLIKAENQSLVSAKMITPFDLKKVAYGRSETRRGIANVLHAVLGTYNYTSLPELNAILKQFNVIADRGAEDGFIYSKRGLLYKVLDSNGNKIGVPIKASNIAGSPTLDNLEKRYEKNIGLRDPLREKLKAKIDVVLLQYPKTMSELSTMLLKQNVVVVARQNAEGKMYGITFVDNQNRSVFNGSEIGRQYSVAGLLKQIDTNHQRRPHMNDEAGTGFIEFNGLSTLAELMKPENEFNPIPYQLKKRKKKRKI